MRTASNPSCCNGWIPLGRLYDGLTVGPMVTIGAWACGEAATRPVECAERDRDRYGRVVAVCSIPGEDLNAWMVEQGWPVAYRKYSTDYVSHETAAKTARRGLWRGDFVEPSRWRRGERLEAPAASRAGDCRIKGNISKKGTRIYHVPGGAWYAKTRIDTAKGER